jgi:hypothetical protein
MVVSAEFVAMQLKKLIDRREQFLLNNSLPMNTVMNDDQKDAFLKEVKEEYHGSPGQLRRQQADRWYKKPVGPGKKQRWSRECQRRGGTTQMFHVLSFGGRWDAEFLAETIKKKPEPTHERQPRPETQQSQSHSSGSQSHSHSHSRGNQSRGRATATTEASEARRKLTQAMKWDVQKQQQQHLSPYQEKQVEHLHRLLDEANRLTRISGHGRVYQRNGSFTAIGGSTGGFTRAALYDWKAPIIEDESWNQSDGWNPSDWSDGWNHHHGWNWSDGWNQSDGWKSTHQW